MTHTHSPGKMNVCVPVLMCSILRFSSNPKTSLLEFAVLHVSEFDSDELLQYLYTINHLPHD